MWHEQSNARSKNKEVKDHGNWSSWHWLNSTFFSRQIIKVKCSLAALTLETAICFARTGNPSVALTTLYRINLGLYALLKVTTRYRRCPGSPLKFLFLLKLQATIYLAVYNAFNVFVLWGLQVSRLPIPGTHRYKMSKTKVHIAAKFTNISQVWQTIFCFTIQY